MENPTYIYNLISFAKEHLEANAAWHARGEAEWEIIKDMSKEERSAHRRSKPPYVPDPRMYVGKSYRGSWLDKAALIQLIYDNPSYIHECYYEYLLIERITIGEVDGYSSWYDIENTDPGELWFKLEIPDGDDFDNMKYVIIPKPDCFSHTCCFT